MPERGVLEAFLLENFLPNLEAEGTPGGRTSGGQAPRREGVFQLSQEEHVWPMSSFSTPSQSACKLLPTALLETEAGFYRQYSWCLNAFPTIGEVIEHLTDEISRLHQVGRDWQLTEVQANIFLLSCGVTDALDDYLLGSSYDFWKAQSVLPFLRPFVLITDWCQTTVEKFRTFRLRHLADWREEWEAALHDFLRIFASGRVPDAELMNKHANRLLALLSKELPAGLRSRRLRNAAAFRSQDLTAFDVLKLGQKFILASPDRQRPILVVGLRTAGSYFAPLLRAFLANEGYRDTSCVTLRPKKGASARELARIRESATRRGLAVIIDEPIATGSTLANCVGILRKSGFAANDVAALFPVHPTLRHWRRSDSFSALGTLRVLTLEPEEYYKYELLQAEEVKPRLQQYFRNCGWRSVSLVESATAEGMNSWLRGLSEEKFHNRLKRIYEVRLQNSSGETETRYVFAKSVGWGWWSYHAFLAGERLAGYVPPLLGLRDGILFAECVSSAQAGNGQPNRAQLVRSVASYIVARSNFMRLNEDPSPDLCRAGWHQGMELLAEVLSQAYGWNPATVLKRQRIRLDLSRQRCPVPTLIDGKMRRLEWVQADSTLLKTDFEHHGLGKIELSVTDPAYDLAEAILYFGLSETEEKELLAVYTQNCEDAGVHNRLFLHKLLAGKWAMTTALANLKDPRLAARHPEFDRQYMDAWNFSTIHTTRFCGALCQQPEVCQWNNPLVLLDIDGVLDKQIFGFPSTTAAGIRAVSLLHAHGLAVAVNTARSPLEVKEYCRAYGFVGGAAEYGSYVWDAVTGRERVLVSQESLEELALVRNALRKLPGVYINEDYQLLVKAYTYEGGRTVPLPTMLVQDLMASLGIQRLTLHQTYSDSSIIPQEVNKGRGMQALLELVGLGGAETLAIGDTEPDLPMFRLATRSFAPAQISCRQAARSLGCHIAKLPYQMGFLEIVRRIVHPDGSSCGRCGAGEKLWHSHNDPFCKALQAADQKRRVLLLRAVLDPMSLQAFRK